MGVRRGTEARGYGVYKASGGGAVRFSHRTGTGKASGFPGRWFLCISGSPTCQKITQMPRIKLGDGDWERLGFFIGECKVSCT
jgi:hypothetical protein